MLFYPPAPPQRENEKHYLSEERSEQAISMREDERNMTDTREKHAAPAGAHTKFRVPAVLGNSPGLVALESTRGEGSAPATTAHSTSEPIPATEQTQSEGTWSCFSAMPASTPHGRFAQCRYTGQKSFTQQSRVTFRATMHSLPTAKNLFLLIATADCYPILLHDPVNQAVAAIHAGWKGTAGRIAIKNRGGHAAGIRHPPGELACLNRNRHQPRGL